MTLLPSFTVKSKHSFFVFIALLLQASLFAQPIDYSSSSLPFVGSFNPASAAEGTTITITGAHFTGTSSVILGGAPAASFTVVSDSVVLAVVGKGANGNITLTTPKGTDSLIGFEFIPAREMAVYPNPAKGYITVKHPGAASPATLSLLDNSGNVIKLITEGLNTPDTRIDITGLRPGVYNVNWNNGSKTTAYAVSL